MPDGLHFNMSETRPAMARTTAHPAAMNDTHNRLWRWILRLALPLLVFLSGLVLYWIWFDQAYGGIGWTTIIVGLPLAVEAAAAALWSVSAWCSNDLL